MPAPAASRQRAPAAQIKAAPQQASRLGAAPKSLPVPAPAPAPIPEPDDDDESDWEEDDDQEVDSEDGYDEGTSRSTGNGIVVKVIALSPSTDSVSQMPITNLEFPM